LRKLIGASLKGKIAMVTGGGSGIGQKISSTLADHGASVCVADLDGARASYTVEMIREAGGIGDSVIGDVSKSIDVERMVNEAITHHGRIDVLVNNAGFWLIGRPDKVADLSEEDWDRVLDVNLKSVFLCSKFVVRQMLKQGGSGVIINMASECGLVGCPGAAAYGAAKAGVAHLTREMALDYARDGIRVNSIAPCNVRTPLYEREIEVNGEENLQKILNVMPLGRLGTPQDIANAALFLISDEASFITGTVLSVDAGVTAGGTHTYPH